MQLSSEDKDESPCCDRFNRQIIARPPMLVDKTNFGSVIYKHANFYRFEKTSSYWSVKRIAGFLCFSLVNQRHTSGISVYNRTVTNIDNAVRPCIAAIAGCEL